MSSGTFVFPKVAEMIQCQWKTVVRNILHSDHARCYFWQPIALQPAPDLVAIVFDKSTYPIAYLSKIQAVVTAMLPAMLAKRYRLRAVVAWPVTVRDDTRLSGVTTVLTSSNIDQLVPLQYGGRAHSTRDRIRFPDSWTQHSFSQSS
jgi:hypothetical protein